MWLKFPTEQAIMFTDEQLKAGANVLKDMTEEQLAQYDWSQMGDDSLAQLPTELKDKIDKLSKVCLVVSRLNLVRNARVSTKCSDLSVRHRFRPCGVQATGGSPRHCQTQQDCQAAGAATRQ